VLKETRILSAARKLSATGLVCALLLAALIVSSPVAPEARAVQRNRKNQPTTGVIEVSTTPGGNPIIIDGRPAGETTEFVRAIELEPGGHTVEIIFPNGTRWSQTFDIIAGRKQCIALNYRPRTINIPAVAVSPCPYPVNVTVPGTVNDGDIVTFSADVSYEGQSALNYTWTVSPASARIVNGAGTPTISVDTTGLGNRRVMAILVADDGSGDRNCRQTAQATTAVLTPAAPVQTRKRFDEFPSVAFDDDKARLDNLAIELQNSPGSVGYIIAYGGRTTRAGHANWMGERARGYLVNTRGLSANRIVVINGGLRETPTFELWVVPQGAEPPSATPTVDPSEARPSTGTRRGRQRR
jgi:hypothetical protein